MNIRHFSPTGALHVPVLGSDVDPGQVVDVPDSVAEQLLAQSEVWQTVTQQGKKKGD